MHAKQPIRSSKSTARELSRRMAVPPPLLRAKCSNAVAPALLESESALHHDGRQQMPVADPLSTAGLPVHKVTSPTPGSCPSRRMTA